MCTDFCATRCRSGATEICVSAILRESVQQKLIGYVAVRHGSLAEEPFGALADEPGGLRRGRFTFVRGELLRQKRNKRDYENDTAKQWERRDTWRAPR